MYIYGGQRLRQERWRKREGEREIACVFVRAGERERGIMAVETLIIGIM